MSLADQIVERNTEQNPNTEVDEFGIPVPHPETPEYLVARALLLWTVEVGTSPKTEMRGTKMFRSLGIRGLHLRDGLLYLGHTPVSETKKKALELTRIKRPIKDWEEVEFWRILKERLPSLNRRILQIAADLYWDIDKAELINRQQAEERSST